MADRFRELRPRITIEVPTKKQRRALCRRLKGDVTSIARVLGYLDTSEDSNVARDALMRIRRSKQQTVEFLQHCQPGTRMDAEKHWLLKGIVIVLGGNGVNIARTNDGVLARCARVLYLDILGRKLPKDLRADLALAIYMVKAVDQMTTVAPTIGDKQTATEPHIA